MKKNRVRLTESQLHQVIKESVKKVLYEIDMQSQMDGNLEDFRDGEDYIDKYTAEPVYDMVDRMRGRNKDAKWDNFDKSIKNNRNMKKWYDNLHKNGQKKDSWDLFDNYKEYVQDVMSPRDYEHSDEYYRMRNNNIDDESQYFWDDYDNIMNNRY